MKNRLHNVSLCVPLSERSGLLSARVYVQEPPLVERDPDYRFTSCVKRLMFLSTIPMMKQA